VKRKGTRKSARTPPRASAVTLVIEDDGWRKSPAALKLIRRAARLALAQPPGGAAALTILLSDDRRLRQLNRQFRGKDRPTNVLSFAARDPVYLGDVAIALGVVEREARAQRKSVPAHAAHLAVHGILHLKGYDHAEAAGRAAMESAETLILARLGLSDPYAPRPYTGTAKAVN
jgi:probable rRNA maturation factor